MMRQAPPIVLPEAITQLLAGREPSVVEHIHRSLRGGRSCVYVNSRRSGSWPLRVGCLGRLLGLKPALPLLSPVQSKWGGAAYAEAADASLKGRRFLGQVNFAEVAQALDAMQHPVPAGMPRQGLLAIDGLRESEPAFGVRWYP